MKEEEIRPREVFERLLELNKEDVELFFDKTKYNMILCPACGHKGNNVFEKDSFLFDECPSCRTLYVSSRPDDKSLMNYYNESRFAKYFASDFYKATQENRREKLWKPKAKLIKEKIDQYSNDIEYIIDIGGGYGVFMEEFLKIQNIKHLIIEPSKHLSNVCRDKGLNVLEEFMEKVDTNDITNEKKAFVSFELFEHLNKPSDFFKKLSNIMNKNDILIFTTLNGNGLDIRVLWEKSQIIAPPAHLNFFNPQSIKILLEQYNFNILEVTTPGKLDVNILQNNKKFINDKFWRLFVENSTDDLKDKMQSFIENSNLSSHMMIVAIKES